MSYEGTVKNGVVVFETAAPPDGVHVRVEEVPQVSVAKSSPTAEEVNASWDEMMTFAGRAEGLPSDLAARHDHYRRERQAK